MANKNYKRRQYFIDKKFQTKFILKFSAVVIISSVLIGGLMFYLSQNSTTVAIENTKVSVKRTSDFIMPIIIETLLVVAVFSVLVVLFLTLFISHKISGPLYRLSREINALKEGDLGRNFNIRTKDQLQSLAKSLDEMSLSLRQNYLELRNKCTALKDYLEKKNFCISENDRSDISRILAEVEEKLNFFKIHE